MLAEIYEQVLELSGVSRRESFFELGGHSLLATQVISRVRELFGVEVALRSLFESPTIAGLGEQVESALRGGAGTAVRAIGPSSREWELTAVVCAAAAVVSGAVGAW